MSLLDQFMNRMTQVKDKVKETLTPSKKTNRELEDYARKMLELSQQGLINAGGNKGMEMIFEQIAGEARKVLGEEAPKHLASPEEPQAEEVQSDARTVEVNTRSEAFTDVDAEEAEFEEVIEEAVKPESIFERSPEGERITSADVIITPIFDSNDEDEALMTETFVPSGSEAVDTETAKASEAKEVTEEIPEETGSESAVKENDKSVDDDAQNAESVEEPVTVPDKVEDDVPVKAAENENDSEVEPQDTKKKLSALEDKTEWINTIVAKAQEKEENIEQIADAIAKAVRDAIVGKNKGEAEKSEPEAVTKIEESVTVEAGSAVEESESVANVENESADETTTEEVPIEKAEEMTPVVEPEPEPEPTVEIDPTAFAGKKIIYGCSQKGGDAAIVQCFKDWQIEYTEVYNGLKVVETFSGSEPGTYDGVILEKNLFLMDAITATKCIRKLKHPDVDVPVGVVSLYSGVSEILFEAAGINAWTTDNTPEALYVMMQKMWS